MTTVITIVFCTGVSFLMFLLNGSRTKALQEESIFQKNTINLLSKQVKELEVKISFSELEQEILDNLEETTAENKTTAYYHYVSSPKSN